MFAWKQLGILREECWPQNQEEFPEHIELGFLTFSRVCNFTCMGLCKTKVSCLYYFNTLTPIFFGWTEPPSQILGWSGEGKWMYLVLREHWDSFLLECWQERLRKHSAQLWPCFRKECRPSYCLTSRPDGLVFRQAPFLALLTDYSGD